MIGAIASTAVQPHMAVPTVSNMELSRLTPNQRQIRGIARPATSRQPSDHRGGAKAEGAEGDESEAKADQRNADPQHARGCAAQFPEST